MPPARPLSYGGAKRVTKKLAQGTDRDERSGRHCLHASHPFLTDTILAAKRPRCEGAKREPVLENTYFYSVFLISTRLDMLLSVPRVSSAARVHPFGATKFRRGSKQCAAAAQGSSATRVHRG